MIVVKVASKLVYSSSIWQNFVDWENSLSNNEGLTVHDCLMAISFNCIILLTRKSHLVLNFAYLSGKERRKFFSMKMHGVLASIGLSGRSVRTDWRRSQVGSTPSSSSLIYSRRVNATWFESILACETKVPFTHIWSAAFAKNKKKLSLIKLAWC